MCQKLLGVLKHYFCPFKKKVLVTSNVQQNAMFLVHSDPILTQILNVGFPGKSL